MSFPCKEELVEIENLAKQQVRIYNDSCDVGLINSPELQKRLHNLCEELAKVYKMKKWNTKFNKGVEFFIPFEQEGIRWIGAAININLFVPVYKKQREFFSITLLHETTYVNPFKE